MPRNYIEIADDISKTGFFSEYLPPCFRLDENAFNYPPVENCDLIKPISFTMSRYNGNDARRSIFIPEIGSYLVAQQYMKNNQIIEELIAFTESENMSFSPILDEDDSVVRHEQSYGAEFSEFEEPSSSFIDNIAKKIIRAAGAKKILNLDISNCFSSFYIHMIPAILLGLEDTEKEYKKSQSHVANIVIDPTYIKYCKLDEIIRHQNENRTNGLLVGVLSSKIIAESILTRIDIELKGQGVNYSRYMDDYEVYLYGDDEKYIISIFEKTLKRYGFSLNNEKTKIKEFPYYVAENLANIYTKYQDKTLNGSELMALFNTFSLLEENGTKGAIRYLLKSIEKIPIETENSELYKAYLLTILGNNERALSKVCSLLIKNYNQVPLESKDIDFIINLLKMHILHEHDLEVLWLLYLLVETTSIQADSPILKIIVDTKNELAKVLLLCKGLFSEELLSQVSESASSWMLLYELYAANHISKEEFCQKLNISKNLRMYERFKNKSIHFCVFDNDDDLW